MSTMNNPNFFAQMTTGTASQIEDSVDFPHTGLIKALSLGMANTYAISGFNASSLSATAITVADGVIIRNGERVAVTGASLTISSSHTNGYNLLVAPAGASPTVVIRGSTTTNKVPAYTDGDTIIAVLTHTGTNPMQIQYLTLNHKTNSLSIARDNSGYTEGLTVKSNAGDIEIEAKEQDKDIIFKVNDGGSPTESMRIDGDINQVKIKSLAVGSAAELTITESSDDISFTNTVNDKTLKFVVNDGSGNDKTATLTAATTGDVLQLKGIEETFIIAASDETTDLTTGDVKATFAAPFDFQITGVKASVYTSPAGSTISVAIRRSRAGVAVDILSTNLTIDPNENTSRTAATAAVINTSNDDIQIDDIIIIDIDQIGSSRAGQGLKVTIFGYRT